MCTPAIKWLNRGSYQLSHPGTDSAGSDTAVLLSIWLMTIKLLGAKANIVINSSKCAGLELSGFLSVGYIYFCLSFGLLLGKPPVDNVLEHCWHFSMLSIVCMSGLFLFAVDISPPVISTNIKLRKVWAFRILIS